MPESEDESVMPSSKALLPDADAKRLFRSMIDALPEVFIKIELFPAGKGLTLRAKAESAPGLAFLPAHGEGDTGNGGGELSKAAEVLAKILLREEKAPLFDLGVDGDEEGD